MENDIRYVFAHFWGPRAQNDNRGSDLFGLSLQISADGFHWKPINGGKPVYKPSIGTVVRDPTIRLGPDGRYRMVWTVSWTGQAIGTACSEDLIVWRDEREIPVMEWSSACVNSWAPEVYYDDVREEWIIFWSSTIRGVLEEDISDYQREGLGKGKPFNNRIYFCTTKDFATYSETRLLYEPGVNVIDATIEKGRDERYYLFHKHNLKAGVHGVIKCAVGPRPTGPYGPMSDTISGNYKFCEGSNLARIGEWWMCYFDLSAEHRMACVRAKTLGSKEWEDVTDRLDFPENVKHGCVLEVPESIAAALAHHVHQDNY